MSPTTSLYCEGTKKKNLFDVAVFIPTREREKGPPDGDDHLGVDSLQGLYPKVSHPVLRVIGLQW